jgi:hypothetical protein
MSESISYFGGDGMDHEIYVIARLKKQLKAYQSITEKLLNKVELTAEEKTFLVKEGIKSKELNK